VGLESKDRACGIVFVDTRAGAGLWIET
jgi:hypothetical protein